jgi:hypothetical protein
MPHSTKHILLISIVVSILVHILWLSIGISSSGESTIVDEILGAPSYYLTILLAPKKLLNSGLLIGWLTMVGISILFYSALFCVLLAAIKRFKTKQPHRRA